MPDPTTTGYLILSIALADDDTPAYDPAALAERVLEAGLPGIVEVNLAAKNDAGLYYHYGPTFVA